MCFQKLKIQFTKDRLWKILALRGKKTTVEAGIESLITLVSRNKSGKLCSQADLFDFICKQEGLILLFLCVTPFFFKLANVNYFRSTCSSSGVLSAPICAYVMRYQTTVASSKLSWLRIYIRFLIELIFRDGLHHSPFYEFSFVLLIA